MKKDYKKWKVLNIKDVSPSPWLKVFKHKVLLPDGRIVDDYFVTNLGNVSMVLATTRKKEIVFVRQYKHGVRQVILELPAGRIKKSQTPELSARSELEEETGFVAKELLPLGSVLGEPAKDSLTIFGFLAENVEIQHKQHLDPLEDIEVVMIPAKEVDKMIENGEISASETITFIKIAQIKYPHLFQ